MTGRQRRVPLVICSANGRGALASGVEVLDRGGTAVDAVEACARIVEADPTETSVGRGGKPNAVGQVELDASIMDGRTRRAGSVAALQGYLHPVSVARAVMEHLPHVMLAGDGAARFAREIGAEKSELLTPSTRALWIEWLHDQKLTPPSMTWRRQLISMVWAGAKLSGGTVDFIAIDKQGEIASAVTTSGRAYKYPGRVGDSPVLGAGNYCDSRWGGATCTGFGELAMRCGTARVAVAGFAMGRSAREVAAAAIAEANALEPSGTFNVLVMGADGNHASAANGPGRQYAYQRIGMPEAVLVDRRVVTRKK